MGEEYDPEEFSVRVSPNLFRVVAGKATEPVPIEPRNKREASLINAVRNEERKAMIVVERDMQARYAEEARSRENYSIEALEAAKAKLHARYADDDEAFFFRRSGGTNADAPALCDEFKSRTIACYRKHGRDAPSVCAAEVEQFAACARRLQE